MAEMLIGGREVGTERPIRVTNPFDGSVVDTVPSASPAEIERALATAVEGARVMEGLSRRERARILSEASALLDERSEDLATLIAREVGKTIREARAEVARAVETFSLSAGEAERLVGEVVPFDAAPTGGDRFGFAIRRPLGVIVAITPFNFPLNLAAHKVAPAIAAGNAVILKPASATPLADLELGRILYEAGLPESALSVVTGPGGEVGGGLVADERPRMVTFTGSAAVGATIARAAGLKRTAMELGSNSAVIVTEHGDVETAARRSVRGAFALAGQVCISVQRAIVHESVAERFVGRAREVVGALVVGDPLDESTDVGPMIDEGEAERASEWIREAEALGGSIVVGGERRGALLDPAILVDTPPEARVWREEAFAPVLVVRPYVTLEEAFAAVNETGYGLQAGIYTDRLEDALAAAHEIRCGGVMVNDVPAFRVDLMPYGGEKGSGLGREGPRYAVREMSELRVVAFRRAGVSA